MSTRIGITEYCDPVFNKSWEKWALKDKEPIILITKNIKKLLIEYPGIENQGNILIHATITGYGNTFVESGVPSPKELLEFLSTKIIDRIILRIDPIIPLENFVKQSKMVYDTGVSLGFRRFRASIMDLYPHVLKRFDKYPELQYELKQLYNWDASHSITGYHKEYMNHAPLDVRKSILQNFPNAEICAEPGIVCDGCLSRKDLESFGIKPEKRYSKNEQREFCFCLGIKKQFGTLSEECSAKCIYCYKTSV
jgi:DNA repair photolyase